MAKSRSALNSPMVHVPVGPSAGSGEGKFDQHEDKEFSRKGDVGPGDISLKFYEDTPTAKKPANLSGPMKGTAAIDTRGSKG
jgi:hypothetical protein